MVKFSIFSKLGGGDTSLMVNPFITKMTKILDGITNKTNYEKTNLQFHIEFRVDGDFYQYGDPNGCSNLKFFRQKNLVAITFALNYDFLKSETNISEYIKETFRLAIEKMLDRIVKEKIPIDKSDVLKVLDMEIKNYWYP